MRLPQSWRSTAIGRTLLVNMAAIGLVAGLAIYLTLSLTIRASFGKLEAAEIQGHQDRAAAYLEATRESLGKRSKDWGLWDDTFAYLTGFNARYEAANINAESFRNALTDAMVFVRHADGELRSFAFDLDTDRPDPALAARLVAEVTSPGFEQLARSRSESQSFITIDGALYALATIQVKRSDLGGTPPGHLVFVQRVNSRMISEALQIPARIDLANLQPQASERIADNTVHVSVPALDRHGRPVAMIRFDMPRRLMAAGEGLLRLTLLATMLLVLAVVLVLNRRIARLVIDPVERLHHHVTAIRASGELRPLEGEPRHDELGALQGEFNAMAAELQGLRAEIEAQSFALGRSQSAIGVMHNVRNSLSPVHVILARLDQQLGDGLPPEVERALGELAAPDTPAERRERLAAFLAAAHGQLGEVLTEARGRTREAGRNLSAALDAIGEAQADRSHTVLDEPCELAGLLGRAANVARFASGAEVALTFDCPARVVARGNRVLLSQVFENLVTNAVEAIQASGRGRGKLTISVRPGDEEGRCLVAIGDDGEGFDAAVGARLFERGFSRRADKHGGLGLHWCANTVNAMGGSLHLASGGPGQGAVATIDLAAWTDARSAGTA